MLSQQKTVQNSLSGNSNSVAGSQPLRYDPQVHISTASGKSVAQYLNICDFVQSTVVHEEDVVLGGVRVISKFW